MFVSSSMTRTEYPMTSLPPSFRADGELDLEDRAPRNVVPDPHRPLVVVRDGADDGQAETRPPFLAGKIRLHQTGPGSPGGSPAPPPPRPPRRPPRPALAT